MSKPLAGKIVLVTGASRGVGKGMAIELAKAGATVYATSRPQNKGDQVEGAGTLDDVVEQACAEGGKIIPVYCDHTDDKQVEKLFAQIGQEQQNHLDLLVNNAVANVKYLIKNAKKKFYELDDWPGLSFDIYNSCNLRGSYICSTLAARMMVPRKSGLIVTISSPGSFKYLFSVLYGVQKQGNDRMIADMARELKGTGVCTASIHPGPVMTETFCEANFINLPLFANAESIYFTGRCLVKLLQDPDYIKAQTGCMLFTSNLSTRYDVRDLGGNRVQHILHTKLQDMCDSANAVNTADVMEELEY